MMDVTTFIVTTFAVNNLLRLLVLLHILVMFYCICRRLLRMVVLLNMLALQAYFTDLKQRISGVSSHIYHNRKNEQTSKQTNKSNRLKQT